MAKNVRDISQLSLPLWVEAAGALCRIENDLGELKGDVRGILLTLSVHAEALALIVPAEVKANPRKLADARAILERLGRRAS
jgi:hypothetical protein